MKQDLPRACLFQFLPVHAEEPRVFPHRREKTPPLPFELETEEIDNIAVLKQFLQAVGDADSHPLDLGRDKCLRPADGHLRPHLQKPPDIRAGDPGMENVSDDADLEPLETSLFLPNGQ